MFPRGSKGWVILQVGKDQDSPSPHRKARTVSVAQKGELEFSQISEVLSRNKSGFSII